MIVIGLELSAGLARLAADGAGLVRRGALLGAKRAAESYSDDVHEWIRAGRAFTPRTGRLEQQTGWRPTADGAEVYSNAPYAGYVERGTDPHVIRPRPGRQALRFFPGGGAGAVIRRAVKHPGTKARPFFFADLPARRGRMLAEARAALAQTLLGSAWA